jgi:hypothetical protein
MGLDRTLAALRPFYVQPLASSEKSLDICPSKSFYVSFVKNVK